MNQKTLIHIAKRNKYNCQNVIYKPSLKDVDKTHSLEETEVDDIATSGGEKGLEVLLIHTIPLFTQQWQSVNKQ